MARWLDYDNDGDQDIYVINDEYVPPVGNLLFRNDGPGCAGWCFSEVAEQAGAATRVMGMGVVADDWDQDGDLDIYFTNAGKMVLLQNQGDGTFVNVAAEAGVDLNVRTVGWGAVSLDYDNDGVCDCTSLWARPAGPVHPLFRNDGTGVFSDIGHASGVDDPAQAWAWPRPTTTTTAGWTWWWATTTAATGCPQHGPGRRRATAGWR